MKLFKTPWVRSSLYVPTFPSLFPTYSLERDISDGEGDLTRLCSVEDDGGGVWFLDDSNMVWYYSHFRDPDFLPELIKSISSDVLRPLKMYIAHTASSYSKLIPGMLELCNLAPFRLHNKWYNAFYLLPSLPNNDDLELSSRINNEGINVNLKIASKHGINSVSHEERIIPGDYAYNLLDIACRYGDNMDLLITAFNSRFENLKVSLNKPIQDRISK